jgi:hypothetical protein
LALFPYFPDIERWVKGLYSEHSVFNYGATVEEADAQKDDRAKALFEFRSRRLNWDVLRHLCLDVIRDQLRETAGKNHKERKQSPQRVVVHKSSRYEPEEREGIEAALRGKVDRYDLLALNPTSEVRLVRAGKRPRSGARRSSLAT